MTNRRDKFVDKGLKGIELKKEGKDAISKRKRAPRHR